MAKAIDLAVKSTPNGLSLVFDEDKGDLEKVEGPDAIQQAVLIALMKIRGEDYIDKNVGVMWRRVVGLADPVFIRGELVRAARYEPRVRRLKAVDVVRDDDARAGRYIDLFLQFETIDGDTINMQETFGV